MYDPNPLGQQFYLKDLDRQAVPRFRSPRRSRFVVGTGTLATALIALLGYFGAR